MRLLAAPLLAMSLASGAAADRPSSALSMHGACVLHLESWEGRYRAEPARLLFRDLQRSGATAVSLSAFVWTDSPGATELRPWNGDARGPEELRRAIRDAKAAGLAVFVKPHVEIGREGERDESVWRGQIAFEDAERAAAWFASYRSFVVDLARLCEKEGVELLAVGLELAGLSRSWPEEWSRLIAEVRAVYSGRLTYCANWWGEFGDTELWRELDLLGIQAFAPLSSNPKAKQAALEAGARRVVDAWARESERWGKPLVVTEFGFKSAPATWVEPWQWTAGRARPLPQARAYLALAEAMEAADPEGRWLVGSFVWLYEAANPRPGTADAGFSPGGKPAEIHLRNWWRRAAGRP